MRQESMNPTELKKEIKDLRLLLGELENDDDTIPENIWMMIVQERIRKGE